MKKASETLVSARWHRIGIWVAMLCLVGWLTYTSNRLYESDRDSVILAAMVTNLPPTLICNRDGVIVFANPQAILFFGVEHNPELLGHNITEWMMPELALKHDHYFQDANRMPLGAMETLKTEFIVHGTAKPVSLEITVSTVNGDRVFTLKWTNREVANAEDQ